MKKPTRFLALLLLFCTLISAFPVVGNAATTFKINGKSISHTSVAAGKAGGCWEYANKIYNKIWGKRFTNAFADSTNILKNLSDDLRIITAENTKKFIESAKLGAVIRVSAAKSTDSQFKDDGAWYSSASAAYKAKYITADGRKIYGHSMILVAKSSTGFTIIQSSGGKSSEKTYTWQGFAGAFSNYVYFKYIKFPGATPIQALGYYTPIQSNLKAYYTLKSKQTSYSAPYDGKVSGQSFSKAVKTFNKGTQVEVSQTVKNRHGNTWMKVAGSTTQFLYSSWLDYQYSITNDKDMGSYTVTKNTYRYATPFTSLFGRTAMKKSTVVNVTGSAVNKNGTVFYRVQAGNANVWMLASTLKKNVTVTYAEPRFTIPTPINWPKDGIIYGTGFGLRGVVQVNCGKITKVTAQIINTSTNAVKISFVATPNAKTFNINGASASDKGTKNGGTVKTNVNYAITFGSLPRGNYEYILTFTAVNGNIKKTWNIPVGTFTVK